MPILKMHHLIFKFYGNQNLKNTDSVISSNFLICLPQGRQDRESATAAEAKAQRDAAELAERTLGSPRTTHSSNLWHPFTVSELFSSVIQQKTFADEVDPQQPDGDWSAFREVPSQRNATSPRWFV